MLFNSDEFLKFFAAFLLLYYLVRRDRAWRNLLIVGASYLFYGWWDWRFLSLLVFSSVVDYAVAVRIGESISVRRRRAWLGVSLAGNLGLLGFFKYYNFFAESLGAALTQAGWPVSLGTLQIVLPVGISFYTFQTMSYTLDVYWKRIAVTRSLVDFLAYVSFFPQLVAGPIERASHLLPQFSRPLSITAVALQEGVWLMIWGLFKKVVVADNLAPMVEMVYDAPGPAAAPMVLMATAAFALQIYGDFSGYSDIARGLARVLGFELMVNFNLPYLATSPRDFWRRWHISLSTWLRDYLYIPLGGSRQAAWRTRLNLLLTMLLGGLWHGAAWNFVFWGMWHGLALVLTRPPGSARAPTRIGQLAGWLGTIGIVLYGWLLFRAGSMTRVAELTAGLARWEAPSMLGSYALSLGIFALPIVAVQAWQARRGDLLAPARIGPVGRAVLQGLLVFVIVVYWRRVAAPFIYFQF